VKLDFVDLRRGSADRYSWIPPFDWSVAYQNEQWWDDVRYYVDDPWFVQVLEDGVEVARVELDEDVEIEHYPYVPTIGTGRLEIQLIEVAAGARSRGVGSRVAQGLTARHPDRRLLAYSEQADGFWASLGWERFDHPSGEPQFHRALFIQPAAS
jgi:hypothetical protein